MRGPLGQLARGLILLISMPALTDAGEMHFLALVIGEPRVRIHKFSVSDSPEYRAPGS
jgi:hypothetical protein